MKDYFCRVARLGSHFVAVANNTLKMPKVTLAVIVARSNILVKKSKNKISHIYLTLLTCSNLVMNYVKIYFQRIKTRIRNMLDEESIFSSNSAIVVEMLGKGDPAKVAHYLAHKYKYFAHASISFLIALYRYASDVEKKTYNFWRMNNKNERVIIHFCCWGSSYSNKVTNYLLPSLLADNNLPLLAEQYNICLLIHCDRATKTSIVSSDLYSKLERYSSVIFCVFPSRLIKLYNSRTKKISSIYPQIRYFLLGVCQAHALKVALTHRVYLSYLMPDVVLSRSFFQHAFSNINDKKLVLTTTYRSNYKNARLYLDNAYTNNIKKDQLSISEVKLLELQIEHTHRCEKKRIVSTTTDNFSASARLIFKNKNGFIFRCFHYHPVIINCTNITKHICLDYLPIDNTALNDVLDHHIPLKDQAWVCTLPSQMAIMELSDEEPEMEVIVNKTTLNYEQLVSQVRDLLKNAPTVFNTPLNQFLATFRHQFVVPDFINRLASDDEIIDDITFFNDVLHPAEAVDNALAG